MVVKGSKKEVKDPRSYITFDDIIALALAKTNYREFVADSNAWQQVLYDIREKYKDRITELNMMFFNESRSDIPPQSEEFYQLINLLSAAKLISLPNPGLERIWMDDSQKRRTRNLEENLLKHYDEYINDIAKILEERIAVRV